MKRKITAFILAVLMLSCVGCAKSENGEATEENTDVSTEAVTETLEEPLCLIEGSKTLYPMVRADETSGAVIELYKTVMKKMKEGGCTTYSGGTDWVKPGTDMSGEKELLIGYTCRDESLEVLNSLSYNDYAITVLNNKIVVAAHNEAKLQEAVQFMLESLMSFETVDGVTSAYLTGTCTKRGDGYGVCGKDGSLSDYCIVYQTQSKIAKDSAEKLQKALNKAYGVEIEIKSEIQKKDGKEIVLGNVARDICRKFESKLDYNTAVAAAADGDILIMGSTPTTTSIILDSFISENVNKYYSNTFNLPEDYMELNTLYTYSQDPARADGTDIRVMSFNILCELWDSAATLPGRDTANYAVIKYYAPDVVGLQEVSDNWYTIWDNLFGDEYAFTDRKNGQGKTNFSTLAYNTNTLTMLDHGVKVFSQGNDARLRLATWAYFEVKATGKRFIAMSTHWDLGKNEQYQLTHAKEMAKLCLELEDKYGCAIVTTGDYNSNEESAPYQNFINLTEYKEAKYAAKVVVNFGSSTHSLGSSVGTSSFCIDHIFGSSKATFLFFDIIKDKAVLSSSDHCPIYADVQIN